MAASDDWGLLMTDDISLCIPKEDFLNELLDDFFGHKNPKTTSIGYDDDEQGIIAMHGSPNNDELITFSSTKDDDECKTIARHHHKYGQGKKYENVMKVLGQSSNDTTHNEEREVKIEESAMKLNDRNSHCLDAKRKIKGYNMNSTSKDKIAMSMHDDSNVIFKGYNNMHSTSKDKIICMSMHGKSNVKFKGYNMHSTSKDEIAMSMHGGSNVKLSTLKKKDENVIEVLEQEVKNSMITTSSRTEGLLLSNNIHNEDYEKKMEESMMKLKDRYKGCLDAKRKIKVLDVKDIPPPNYHRKNKKQCMSINKPRSIPKASHY